MKFFYSDEVLLDYIDKHVYDAIVVEGFDGVGKGRVLNLLSEHLGVTPYRPDYNLWQKYDHRPEDRWKVSGFFWDIYSHFNINHTHTLLFDRGVISGAVYNNDYRIAEDYKKLLGDMSVLHILVTCNSTGDYLCFAGSRGAEVFPSWDEYREYTERYRQCLDIAGVDNIEFCNIYDVNYIQRVRGICEGCGHYNYGYCRHPAYNCKVDKDSERCDYYKDKETQDREEVVTSGEV